jgi:hypothetical protein
MGIDDLPCACRLRSEAYTQCKGKSEGRTEIGTEQREKERKSKEKKNEKKLEIRYYTDIFLSDDSHQSLHSFARRLARQHSALFQFALVVLPAF